MWDIDWTDEFEKWLLSEDAQVRKDTRFGLGLLREAGPHLGRPYVDTIKGSRFSNLKELRVQSKGRPIRIFFAFNPIRQAVLLIGGNKHGRKRFYEQYVPLAEQILEKYLKEFEHEKRKEI